MSLFRFKLGLFFILFTSINAFSQNTGISDVNRNPDASAVLDVFSTTKGMLAPRLTAAQRTAIASPATGLLVYQTDGATPGFYYYTGTTWTPIAAGAGTQWTPEPSTSNIYYTAGNVGVGVTNPRAPMVVNNTLEIRRTGTVAQLLFTGTAGNGDFRVGSDGGDIYWQGGGGRSLQMGSYWTTVLSGDRQGGFPDFVQGSTTPNIGVLVRSSRDVSVPLAIQGFSSGQSANLTEWLNSSGTPVSVIDNQGNMGIGTSVFSTTNKEKLLVDAGVTTSVTAISAKGNINSYFQTNIQNLSTGNQSSADIVATANNGTETTNYVNLGINGGGYVYEAGNTLALGQANDGYLLSAGQNFFIANNNAAKDIAFLVGGTAAANEAMRITFGQNVGIGVTAPTQKLEVTGNFRLNGAFMPGNQAGAVGNVLQSNGPTAAPTWVDLASSTSTLNWALNGNTLTGIKNFGTTSNTDLPIITSGAERMRILAGGNVGIGTATPSEKLEVNGNIKLTGATGGTRRLSFLGTVATGNSTSFDPDGIIEVRPVNTNEQQEMLFYMGNDNLTDFGPDRIRMVAEEFRFQNFNAAAVSNLANAESGTNLNTRMLITPTGNVGIGTDPPAEKLDVAGNLKISGAFMPAGAAGTAGYVLQSNGTTTAPSWIDLSSAANQFNWSLGGNNLTTLGIKNFGTTSNTDLPFITNGTVRMRILTSGNVGIGVSPTQKLEVGGNLRINGLLMLGADAGTAGSVLQSNGPSSLPAWVDLSSATNTYNWAQNGNTLAGGIRSFGTINSVDLPFITNNTERMRILAGGNVGIGTATPSEKLEVNGNIKLIGAAGGTRRLSFLGTVAPGSAGTGDPDGIIEVRPVGLNEQQEMLFYMGNDNTTTYGPDRIRMVAEELRFQTFNNDANSTIGNAESQTGVNTRMLITPAGNVGIGTDPPLEKLDVTGNFKLTGAFMPAGSAGTAGQVLQSNGPGASPTWVASGTSSSWTLGGNNLATIGIKNFGTTSNTDLPIITNNFEIMRITAAGNIGMGTPAPFSPLHISTGPGGNLLYLQGRAGGLNSTAGIIFKTYGDVNGVAGNPTAQITAIDDANYSNHLTFSTKIRGADANPLAERLRIASNGNVGIATNAPNSTLSVNGSVSMAVRTVAGTTTIAEADYVVINTLNSGDAVTWTLPAAANNKGRIYRLVNHGTTALTLSQLITNGSNGSTTSNLASNSSFEIISDGLVWRRID